MKYFFKSLFLITAFLLGEPILTTPNISLSGKKIKYQTNFGRCPARSVGSLVLKLIKTFESDRSLKEVKQRLIDEKLLDQHFISDYRISFDPMRNFLKFRFECPIPLMKAQIYKENSADNYKAILVDSGRLVDPTYEVLLKGEDKLKHPLPYLAIPVGEMDHKVQARIAKMVKKMSPSFKQKLSEIILQLDKELTIILSIDQNPSSVFLGDKNWEGKIAKLERVVNFMQEKQRIPTIINLTNSDKVVVKFNGRF